MRTNSLFRSMRRAAWLAPVAALLLTACFESPNDSGNNGDGDTLTVPTSYAFLGADGLSSVVYTGQTVRLLLIHDIQSAARVAGTSAGTGSPVTADSILKYYQHVDADSLSIRTSVGSLQRFHAKYANIQLTRSLHDKVSPDTVIGFGVTTDSLVRRWAVQIAANSQDPAKRGSYKVYLDSNGMDLSQMISKVLSGSVAYYRGTEEYLKGIDKKRNDTVVAGTNYTQMEHNWDEAFGYFGASRDYVTNYSDAELESPTTSYKDANGDGKIDFRSEFNFSMMGRYAGRRDVGIAGQDWSGDIFRAFVKGRALISAKKSNDSITAQRAIIADRWEKVYAANVVTYIKSSKILIADTTKTIENITGGWSELKAFAVCLQFSPTYRKISAAQLAELQGYIGHGPALSSLSARMAYNAQLDSALALVKSVYGFSEAQISAF